MIWAKLEPVPGQLIDYVNTVVDVAAEQVDDEYWHVWPDLEAHVAVGSVVFMDRGRVEKVKVQGAWITTAKPWSLLGEEDE